MSKFLVRAWFGVFIFACVLGLALSRHSGMMPAVATTPSPTPAPLGYASATPSPVSPAYTSPNQNIYNAASATYSDGTNTYNILSNTVTVVVQNAPSLVVLTNNGTSQGVVGLSFYPGDNVFESYTLVNTGNGSGNFQLATAAQASPTPLPGTNNGSAILDFYGPSVVYDVSCGTALNALETSLAAVNTDLANASCLTAPNGSVNLGVAYETLATGFAGSTIEAQISYAASGSAAAASSLWVTNNYRESVLTDMRVDIQKSPAPMATDGTITYQVTAHNGGYGNANYINGMGTTCSTTVTICGQAITGPGMLIVDKVPLNASNTPLPVVTVAPSVGPRPTAPAGTVTVVYTTDTAGKQNWATPNPTGTIPPTARYVGIYLTGSGYALPGDPTPAVTSTPGVVPAAAAQVGFSVTLGPLPGGLTVNNVITGPAGDNKSTPCIEGPGLTTTATTCDANGGNPGQGSPSPGDPSISYGTAPPSPSAPGPGISNTTSNISPSLYNGPNTVPDAVGCFNTHATPVPFPSLSPNPYPTISPTTSPTCAGPTPDNNDDFTEAVSTPNPSTTKMPYGAQMIAASTVTVTNQVKNPNGSDVLGQLSFPYLPPTLTVTSLTIGGGPNCAGGTAATVLQAGPPPVYSLGTLAANTTTTYCVTYTTTTGSSAPYYFQPQYVDLRAASQAAPTIYYNDTWNTIMPGGFVELVKQANIMTLTGGTLGNCKGTISGGLPSLGICPGGVIQYAVAYVNTLPAVLTTGTPAEPTGASLSMSGNLVITEDGAANGSNWTTYTNGLFDPAGTPPSTVLQPGLTYATMLANCGKTTISCGDSNASATFAGTGGNVVGSTSFTDTIPGASITAQSVGELVFAVQVK